MSTGTKPQVHNKRWKNVPSDAVYIGRPGPWGNPFTHLVGQTRAEFKVATRDDAVTAYRDWVLKQPQLVEAIRRDLKGKHLVCWCKPASCHGDILLEIANEPEKPIMNKKISNSSLSGAIGTDKNVEPTLTAATRAAQKASVEPVTLGNIDDKGYQMRYVHPFARRGENFMSGDQEYEVIIASPVHEMIVSCTPNKSGPPTVMSIGVQAIVANRIPYDPGTFVFLLSNVHNHHSYIREWMASDLATLRLSEKLAIKGIRQQIVSIQDLEAIALEEFMALTKGFSLNLLKQSTEDLLKQRAFLAQLAEQGAPKN